VIEWLTRHLTDWGYPGIVVLMFVENLLPPIPSELIMPLAGFSAARGDLHLAGVIAAGVIGSVLGALPWSGLGRLLGRERLARWADRHGRWLTMTGADVDAAGTWVARHGTRAVLFGAGASMERLASLAPEQYRQAAAKTLGLTIPASLLLRADQVIE
jgi:membrane protein DedA with SNARE-associated domain